MNDLLPNQQFDDSDLVSAANTRAICYGVQRSGSSYVWQLLRDVFGGKGIIKTHNYLPAARDIPIVCTYRDFRDCLVSAWRLNYPERTHITEDEIQSLCAQWCKYVIAHLNHYTEHVPASLFLRYEDFIANPNVILQSICKMRDVDEQVWQKSLIDHNMEKNRQLSSGPLAGDLLLVPNHVHEGEVGTWRRFVDDAGAKLITNLLSTPLLKWGYTL